MKNLILLSICSLFFACQPSPENTVNNDFSGAQQPIHLGEPESNAGTSLLTDNDGSLMFIFRNGDWDYGGFSDTVFFKTSDDEGHSWSEVKPLVVTPGKPGQCFSTISLVSGEIIVFYKDGPEMKYARSENNRSDWTIETIKTPDNAPINTIGYGNSLWIKNEKGNRLICGFHVSNGTGCGVFYSDDDGKSWEVSERVNVANSIPNIWQTGAVEPSITELSDGRLLMFIRNSNFNIWKSYSDDNGVNWSEPIETDLYCGDNSWITLKKLSDGRHVLVWNNAKSLRPEVTLDKWNFSCREVLHMAISEDDCESWTGFRELMIDKLRDGGFINHPGDKGLNESKLAETKNGNILMALGQAPEHRTFVLVDPNWLYQNERSDDFSNGLAHWSRQKLLIRSAVYNRFYHHNYERIPGAVLAVHPDIEGKKVLHIRRPADTTVFSQRDGAVWNFPAGKSGYIETKIMLNKGFRGASIALNDRWFQPIDNQGKETAMFVLEIPSNGKISDEIILGKEKWHKVRMTWNNVPDKDSGNCEVLVDDQQTGILLQMNNPSPHGISYLRFRSATRNSDNDGMFIEKVHSKVQ